MRLRKDTSKTPLCKNQVGNKPIRLSPFMEFLEETFKLRKFARSFLVKKQCESPPFRSTPKSKCFYK